MLSVEQLCTPSPAIQRDTPAADALAIFESCPRLRLLPVLAPTGEPVGALFEEDVRQILFNPYGHALLRNPAFGGMLAERIRPCPTADIDFALGEVLGLYSRAGGQEGMIITRDGKYHGVIENRALVSAAGAYELERIRRREEELDRLRRAGAAFEVDIDRLARALGAMAGDLGQTAAATAEQGEATGESASAVATAAGQTGDAMMVVASHGGALADALDRLHSDTALARRATAEAVELVAAGTRRADVLYDSTRSIETVTRLIDELARKVNVLAINATIEAARAGEAGRGFGIVAGEVRGLATQTRSAAEEIRRHAIEARSAVEQVVAGNGSIAEVVAGVDRLSRTVETRVEERRRMTREIAENARQAAAASQEICSTVEGIHANARQAASGANEMQHTARALADISGRLTARVVSFLEDVRAA